MGLASLAIVGSVYGVFGLEGVEEILMANEETVGFDVADEVELGDLSGVKEEQVLVPAATNVLFRVAKASSRTSQDGSLRSVSLELRLVDGVELPVLKNGQPTGETEVKYKNKPMFTDVAYWVDTTKRTGALYTGANRGYLNPLKQFLTALGYDITQPPKINDIFFSELKGRELQADITMEARRALDASTGEWVDTGEKQNRIRRFKPA